MTGRLLSVGDIVIDITATIPELPARGGDVLASSGDALAGGAGFNVLVAARRLGATTVHGGTHGTGLFGDLARASLTAEGIEVLLPPVPELDTGWDVALTDAGKERTFITAVGAEAQLTAERIAQLQAAPGDVVYVSGYGLLSDPNRSAIAEWLGRLDGEVTVVTDPGPLVADIPLTTLASVRSRTQWWSCNEREAEALTGARDPVDACRMLAAEGMGVIVRLGKDGCLLQRPGDTDPLHLPGVSVETIDSNGAGDAHVGAFIASLLAGLDPESAARRANAAAAFAVTRSGPATGPTSAQLSAFLLEHGLTPAGG